MAACRLSAHDLARSEEELGPERLATARRFFGTANGDRYITRQPRPEQENIAFRIRPQHWLSQHQGKGHAQNVQIRTPPALISRERTTAQIGRVRAHQHS
jgi:hypothetical protein